jgi:kynurenine formamidase
VSDALPSYRELPVTPGAPPGSSWGVWGPEDELGTLNLLTDARTLAAVRTVERGQVFPLQLPLEEPAPGIVWRKPPEHHVVAIGDHARDDYVDGLWLQGSSQWDGLSHVRHPEHGNYNGVADADIHGGPGTRLGVDRWAARAVVGRAVLVDVARWYASEGRPLALDETVEISPADLDACLGAQAAAVEPGDILLLHTGWMAHVLSLPLEERASRLDPRQQQVPGLQVSERTLEWLWDAQVAAVAADNVGVEACGPGKRFELHASLLALLGLPLGEYWWLHDLAADCAADGRYTSLLVSVPLNLRGGVGSPAQAVAIK